MSNSHRVTIARRQIGRGSPCLLIAEAGVNHNGRLDYALALVDAAADAGADVVKFQTFKAERLASALAPKATYQCRGTPKGESQRQMLERLELSPSDYDRILEHCRQRTIQFLSTPFDESSADFLSSLDVPAFKIPSGEITNLPLLAHIAKKQKPCLLSTGMSSLGEVESALKTLSENGNPPVILLHCTSSYPTSPSDANLRAMRTLRQAFQLPVGYSDHTPGIEVGLAAVALGARVLEKHLTLDKSLDGPDQRVSLEPTEWKELARSVRSVESALGRARKAPVEAELEIQRVARKSLVASEDIPAGTRMDSQLITICRPGTGLSPASMNLVIGRMTKDFIPAGTPLQLEHFA